jgi:cytochrome oxidase Cu insertion factor (SCO1/SenC/PrrC family)
MARAMIRRDMPSPYPVIAAASVIFLTERTIQVGSDQVPRATGNGDISFDPWARLQQSGPNHAIVLPMRPTRMIPALLCLMLVVGACAAPTSPSQADAAWRTEPLLDVRTGESFRIDDLRGKLVAIEPMAVWCTSCRAQQREVSIALEELGSQDIVFISVGVDPNERAEALADYAEQWGFDWRFAVAPTAFSRSLADEFGAQVLSPPSTPMIVLDAGGAVVDNHFGIRRAEQLLSLLSAHLP